MQKIYINTARVIVLIAIAAILLLLVQFKLQHWKIGPALYVVLGVLVAIVMGDIYWNKVKK
ncbi:multisubunit Na+/H+ antiporter MnhB subunit [Dyadobacter sp. BE34]|uniref:Multisubunit Na+/H+ antiporter MnhB subunit n=1 Tax=Dyadobacter fermentans TaxID=94254 RepID=A0ABU1QUF0_9BACT|nr:multisubunit Na+/H+ antiporter MnhB subunit [Dyadobacter fermentans]MDR7043462.1 multisubunit Na+/H+ antiporter MnhB subunit [Dyadobacter sp. BE242]MDR7197774.1 multisubunit Na+/H+ antiporter MnhB subunit [Dyadobacter sp. BE34]MDR7214793.1 multisubunit Na+/H+ antiporter MnhB subunit [Dyadobacter sp. BE31]MDR7262328.1 multisubunit Na+/H+ antiporter MnhB subunit [Dyadobacter sp. BE32]